MDQIVPVAESPLAASALEKRLVFRILELWRAAHRTEDLPQANALTPTDTGKDADYIYMIDVADPAAPRFTYIGEALQIDSWPQAAEALVTQCPENTILGLTSRHWHEIVERGVPVTRGGLGQHEGGPVLYRSILVPLADASGKVSAIMGAANWRTVEEQDVTLVD